MKNAQWGPGRLATRLIAIAGAFVIAMGVAMPVSAGTATSSKFVGLDGGGSAPTGAQQSAKWTPAQLQTYANKLHYAAAVAAQNRRTPPAGAECN